MPIEAPKSKEEYIATLAAFDAEVTRLTREHKAALQAVDVARRSRDQATYVWEASHPRPTFNQIAREVAACQRADAQERRATPTPPLPSQLDVDAYYKRGDPNDPNAFVRRRMRGYGASRGASPIKHPKPAS